jgi:D-proline reductase (dithiol) PrdB
MGSVTEFSLTVRAFLAAYPWRQIDPVPWAPLPKPLSQCRVAIASSAGFVMPGQERFDNSIKGGDWSFREIPGDVDPATLRESHRSGTFDHSGIRRDPNLAFPIDRLRELARSGRIGEVAPRHFSFMGSIVAPGRFLRDTVPAMAGRLVDDGVDVALLVPV